MILEFRVNENAVQAAWLSTLYDLIEELNCRCNTYLEETYSKTHSNFARTRIVEVYGSSTMVSWLKLRMERYNHLVNSFNDEPKMRVISNKDED
ncbi:MAG: hypothetical protein A2255_08850 [Candidatus Melainabacteria bacterium RIFOXYA2_FULL_32_9]|nr:MAG: hypothetical protein A2255_08850 [Candidatus Melainabacteria bacterium RIFOXYA2_FULL_32_9]